MKKLITIITSRFTKPKEDKETERKRKICRSCEFNSLNSVKIKLSKRILIKMSDFYSWITGKKEEDNLGNCVFCSSCSIYYKILMSDQGENCEAGKWDKNV